MKHYHRARRLAIQGLCCLDAQGEKARPLASEFIGDSRESPDIILAARELMRAVSDVQEECDRLLSKHCRHWSLERLAMVDRCILRLGCFELKEAKHPPKVVISEALKLAQEFSTAESPRFINGVLDAVYKDLQQKS